MRFIRFGRKPGGNAEPSHLEDLGRGRPYTIGAQWPDSHFAQMERDRYPDTGQLTRGLTPGPQVSDRAWVACLRQYGRSLVIDLGSLCSVVRVTLSYLSAPGAGIFPPHYTGCYVSSDGSAWFPVPEPPEVEPAHLSQPGIQTLVWDVGLQARHVRLQFVAAIYVFAAAWRVLGHTRPRGGAAAPGGAPLTAFMGQDYLVDPLDETCGGLPYILAPGDRRNPESTGWRGEAGRGVLAAASRGYLRSTDHASGGIRNLQLVYTGGSRAGTTWQVDDFLPMVGRPGEDGAVSGWLFDGSLFLPYADMPTTAEAWTKWRVDLFASGQQIHALDEAVARVGERLGDGAFTHKVVLALPGTAADTEDFGPLPALAAEKVNLNPRTVGYAKAAQYRWAALTGFLEQLLADWQCASFSRLKLAGVYWQPEAIRPDDPYDRWLIACVARQVHAAGLRLYWIPYYGAPGIPEAEQLGFDAVMIQPHAAFDVQIDPDLRLASTANMAQWYGHGVEMELHWDILNVRRPDLADRALRRFRQYLNSAPRYGFGGDVTKAWYLGAQCLLGCYRSADPVAHSAYTDTVRFLSGGDA